MTTQAPGQAPQAEAVQATPAAPAPSAPAADGYDPQWLTTLDQKRQADVQAWADHYHQVKVKAVDTELQSLRTQLGVARKAAQPEIVAMLGDHDTFLEELKQTAVTLYGVSEDDVKDASTVRELRLLVRGLRTARQAPAAKNDLASDADPATQEAWKAFLASRNPGVTNSKGLEPMAPRGGVPSTPQVTKDNIDALYMEAERSGANPNPYAAKYQQFLRYGRL